MDNFLRKSKLNFWTKNEDLEQCDWGENRQFFPLEIFHFKGRLRMQSFIIVDQNILVI